MWVSLELRFQTGGRERRLRNVMERGLVISLEALSPLPSRVCVYDLGRALVVVEGAGSSVAVVAVLPMEP